MTDFFNFLNSQSDERFAGIMIVLVILIILSSITLIEITKALTRIKMCWPKWSRKPATPPQNKNDDITLQ